ncbi:hypothetical protein JAAARDRAFT_202123 [Jaapia argillacea MUCL 33604]|uniref:Phospholipid/glycerol acyltransferase domain-containing protein n=1 Tax=Jaapia argillacea MUCL 33604 TaxID=933084 RepID=A0A067QCQ7_9AGAM|nr:hypothetical protein JAAARDRAFT_202123 [Jaapia argillacea MUCL 33604]
MEKYSAFRDPGTGIQPFLTPVPPLGSDASTKYLLPIAYILGILRTLLVLTLTLVYILLVRGVCLVFTPIPPLHRAITFIFTALISRLVLLSFGLLWIPVEVVSRKRGKGTKVGSWSPRAGDIIISNWVSWIEILWLAFRYNPIFLLPIPSSPIPTPQIQSPSRNQPQTPGRRTGTGSAALSSPTPLTHTSTPRIPINKFKPVSLLQIIGVTGTIPQPDEGQGGMSLEDIRSKSDRPVVLFPECTTSNGRGMLRFGEVGLDEVITGKGYNVFLMCVRYDPPTPLSSTLTHSIPSSTMNPLPHLFQLTTSLAPPTLSVRLVAPSEPLDQGGVEDAIAGIGKMKRIGMGWEDKARFLDFYWGKTK